MSGLLREVRALIELLILPAIAMLLPWSWCSWLYWKISRFDWLFRLQVSGGYPNAAALGMVANKADWQRRVRYHMLVDNADAFLTLVRGAGWIKKYICLNSQEPVDWSEYRRRSCLFVAFHYGQGFWALCYFLQQGIPVAFLHLPMPQKIRWGEYIQIWMGRWRIQRVRKISGAQCISTGGSVEKITSRLAGNGAVLVMPDVPLKRETFSLPMTLIGRRAHLAAGALRYPIDHEIPIHAYTMVADPKTGLRQLNIFGAISYQDGQELGQRLGDLLSEAIASDSAAWYGWPYIDTLLDD